MGANVSISLSFRFCLRDGILLYTTDSTGGLYFSVGVYNSDIVVQFDTGDGLREVRWAIEVGQIIAHTVGDTQKQPAFEQKLKSHCSLIC